MLVARIRGVGSRLLHREMIEESPGSQVGRGLRDELRPPHVTVPESGGRDRELGSLLGEIVCRVLVGCRQIDIIGGRSGSVDIPLVSTNFHVRQYMYQFPITRGKNLP